VPPGFDAVELDAGVIQERVEQPDGVRAAADTGDQRVGQAALSGHHLRLGFATDDRLEIPHHRGIWMRTSCRANNVVGVRNVSDPVAQSFIHGIFERARARRDCVNFGLQQVHPEDVRLLPLDVGFAHVNLAGQIELGANGGHRDAMLPRTGFGNDTRFTHALGQQDLAETVINLVAAGMVELVALEIDFRAIALFRTLAAMLGDAFSVVKWAWATGIVGIQVIQRRLELRVGFGRIIGLL
jgi:hypothetical protein